jgi:hypothetical protein
MKRTLLTLSSAAVVPARVNPAEPGHARQRDCEVDLYVARCRALGLTMPLRKTLDMALM